MTKRPGAPLVTQKRLQELLSYNDETKGLFWKSPTSGRAIAGNRIGGISTGGHRRAHIDGRQYREDALIRTFLYGEPPALPRKSRYITERPLTHKTLLQHIFYNPETGAFIWRNKIPIRKGWALPGDAVNAYKGHYGYGIMQVFGNAVKAHRLAWFYMTGEWPQEYIDHINGNHADNRWANLRAATKSENARNNNGHRRRKSPYKGTYKAKNGRWGATISLGTFDTPEDAHAAYCRAAEMFFGEFANFGKHRPATTPE